MIEIPGQIVLNDAAVVINSRLFNVQIFSTAGILNIIYGVALNAYRYLRLPGELDIGHLARILRAAPDVPIGIIRGSGFFSYPSSHNATHSIHAAIWRGRHNQNVPADVYPALLGQIGQTAL